MRTNHPQMTAPRARQQMKNSALLGAGASDIGDRGAFDTVAHFTANPHTSNDFVTRWRSYVTMYETSWEARKIIRIPVEDALRKQWVVEDIEEEMMLGIQSKLKKLNFTTILSRSLMLERLLGGCLTFMGLDSNEDEPDKAYHPSEGATLRFMNAIPVSRIQRLNWDTNPLSANYMRPNKFIINGQSVDVSRFLVWDGEPLFDPYDFALTHFRGNLAGFGPSKLAAIWDDVIKAVGTRQAAYHLIKTNNAILMAVNDLQDLQGTKSGQEALRKLKEIANNISVYKAAMIDGEKVNISQSAASFGSVPELIITFIQILSAASDIPATRFLGQAPGGLNATGESDLENYYNMIDAFQMQRIEPALRRVYDVIGYSLYRERWKKAREKLTFKFPPLWNESELEEAQKNMQVIANAMSLVDAGLMSEEKAIQEINAKGALSVTLDESDINVLDDTGLSGADESEWGQGHQLGEYNPHTPNTREPQQEIQRLRNMAAVPKEYDRVEKGVRNVIKVAGGDPDVIEMDQFEIGFQDEMEHFETLDRDTTKVAKVVVDHLMEDKDYYRKKDFAEENFINQINLDDLPEPTEAQRHAGNYKKHHLRLHGLDISIENPQGSTRRGKAPDGTEWESVLPAHYGYVKKTEGADGDHVDVYVGPQEESELVFIVDQYDLDTGEFDEHKCIFGALSTTQAKALYLDAFSDGRGGERMKEITPMHVSQFKQWLESGDTKTPYSQEEKQQ